MATSKDRAVLQAILNPSAPFGDILGFAEEEEAAAVQGEGALQDLDTALHLSRGTGHVACQCFVQRGLLSLLQGHKDKARLDFEQAAGLGSAFARHQLVLMNPYSALCNQMLSEVMRKLQNPDIQGSN
ncbi:tetratricopeptide repeat protein 36 isoform X4 [Pelodiscus sinensis]|uniref:tetratricopeptide repeat protein 36 isoform X4 n=1 Tax=Pelodiscus sinensis TaxID=13735 RepID=UPI003F6D32B7